MEGPLHEGSWLMLSVVPYHLGTRDAQLGALSFDNRLSICQLGL